MKHLSAIIFYLLWALSSNAEDRPNILIMISDDQSFPHTSAYGSKMVQTPNFDRIARAGILFDNAYCAAPGCSPSRAAFLTGRHIWQIEHAGTHASSFDKKYRTFMDLLAEAGYATGHTGKGWSPGNYKAGGRTQNPAGPSFRATKGNYAEGFKSFLAQRPKEQPFCFWFGSHDPHRGFEKGSGLKSGKTLGQAEVPAFLPDTAEIRSDLLDYAFEVERFDRDCGKMLALLKQTGELENTLIIITSDNGMAFPYAKANCTEFGIHMPLAVSWKRRIPGSRRIEDPVSFLDLTATIHEIANLEAPKEFPLSGKSLLTTLSSKKSGSVGLNPDGVLAGRERHSSSRYNTLSYPQRSLRAGRYLLIKNLKPDRWPAGPSQKFTGKPGSKLGPKDGGYHDIDACPTLSFLIKNKEDSQIGTFLDLAVRKRPAIELYDIKNDPGCLRNLADDAEHAAARSQLIKVLEQKLSQTNDPRSGPDGDIFETYKRYSSIRWFPEPDWAKQNPESIPEQTWIEELRNK
ncbi:MAG: N-sulfoglucosamine sulfohydrolase [Verrucomicrobiales bacterium]|jgi:N-sulfoglucosamine sulfohydrolase